MLSDRDMCSSTAQCARYQGSSHTNNKVKVVATYVTLVLGSSSDVVGATGTTVRRYGKLWQEMLRIDILR